MCVPVSWQSAQNLEFYLCTACCARCNKPGVHKSKNELMCILPGDRDRYKSPSKIISAPKPLYR